MTKQYRHTGSLGSALYLHADLRLSDVDDTLTPCRAEVVSGPLHRRVPVEDALHPQSDDMIVVIRILSGPQKGCLTHIQRAKLY